MLATSIWLPGNGTGACVVRRDVDPIDTDTFSRLVEDALEDIPTNLRAQMENVAIMIDDTSPPGPL